MFNSDFGNFHEWDYFEQKGFCINDFIIDRANIEIYEYSFLSSDGIQLSANSFNSLTDSDKYLLMLQIGSCTIARKTNFSQKTECIEFSPLANNLPCCMLYYLLNWLEKTVFRNNWKYSIDVFFPFEKSISKCLHQIKELYPLIKMKKHILSPTPSFEYDLALNSLIMYDDLKTIPWQLKKRISCLTIEKTVTTIKSRTFQNATNLQLVNMKHGVKDVETQAFSNCSQLKSIVLPDSLSTIGICSFFGCTKLKNITVSPHISFTVDASAFLGCPHLNSGNESIDTVLKKNIPLDARSLPDWNNMGSDPFFNEDEQILVNSTGSWEQDLAEAQHRMDEVIKFKGGITGEWSTWRSYECVLHSETYYHYHDGEDTRGEGISIRRISMEEFFLDMQKSISCDIPPSFGYFHQIKMTPAMYWDYPIDLRQDEGERYYLDIHCLRIHNFLGMLGYFEIKQYSF